jgi:hypothetical protein
VAGTHRCVGAHRVAYALANGIEPPAGARNGLWVLHSCNTRKCCNPRHLYLGTHRDNMDDMIVSGNRCRIRCVAEVAPTYIPKKMPPAGTPYWNWLIAHAEDRRKRTG